MTLTLNIRNVDRLENGSPTEFVLNRRGAMIGRAATCDWSLPDPRSFISSRHAEVSFRDGFYILNDISTNGTFLNGAGDRMTEPRRIEQGDLFLIGHYEMVAALSGAAVVAVEREEEEAAAAANQAGGFSWDAGNAPPPPAASDRGGWGDVPANSGLSSGAGGMSVGGGWSAGGGDGGGWDSTPPASGGGWGSAPAAPAGGDDWGAAPAAPAGGGDWGGAPATGGGDAGWRSAPGDGDGGGWAPSPAAPPAGGGWGSAPAPSADNQSWMPEVKPSLSAPTPYAQRGGGGMAPIPPAAAPVDSGNSWAPVQQQAEERAPSPWDSAQAPVQQASAWSSPVSDRPAAKSPNDIWGSMEQSNVVDWGRAFGDKAEDAKDLLGLGRQASDALPKQLPAAPIPSGPAGGEWASQPAAPPPPAPAPMPPAPPPAPPPAQARQPAAPAPATPMPANTAPPVAAPPTAAAGPDAGQIVAMFGAAAGLKPDQIKQPSAETLERAGRIMKKLVSGLVVMVEARARAKSQMGAEQTGLEFDGNNPIKFARTPDQALAQLLNPPERGFMPSEKAVEDAFFDLQSHQMATLKAMQGALRATLDRFSPAAIKKRAETGGFLKRIMPGSRESTLWQTYEREFSGVSEGSAEAFMDVFAKEFRQAYDELARNRNR